MRLSRLLVIGVAVLAIGAVTSCTTAPPPKKELTAQEIVDKTSAMMKAVKSIHFRLEMSQGKMTVMPGITLDTVEGDAAAPDKVSMKSKATVAGFVADVELVGVDDQQFIRNPLTKEWQQLPAILSFSKLFAPDTGATAVMMAAKNLGKAGNETIEGADTYHLKGTIDPAAITALLGGNPATAAIPVEAWIGTSDFFVRQIRLQGAVTQDDAAGVVRLLKLSKFNEPVSIEAPK